MIYMYEKCYNYCNSIQNGCVPYTILSQFEYLSKYHQTHIYQRLC